MLSVKAFHVFASSWTSAFVWSQQCLIIFDEERGKANAARKEEREQLAGKWSSFSASRGVFIGFIDNFPPRLTNQIVYYVERQVVVDITTWKPARRHSCQRRMMANSYERTMQRETRLWHFCRIKFLFFHVETLEIFVKERWSNNSCKYRTWKIEYTNVAIVMRIHRIACQINFPLKIIRSRTTCVNKRIKFDRFY